jgi:hypothetical protein
MHQRDQTPESSATWGGGEGVGRGREGGGSKKVSHTCQESTSRRMRVGRITQNYVEL